MDSTSTSPSQQPDCCKTSVCSSPFFAAARPHRGGSPRSAGAQHARSGGQCGAQACLCLPQGLPHPSRHAPCNRSTPAPSVFRYAAERARFLHFQSCKYQGQTSFSGEIQGLGKSARSRGSLTRRSLHGCTPGGAGGVVH